GERVGVALTLNTEATPLTVPWSAVLYDVHGGAWVYEVVGDRTFERRRVHVEYVVDGKAVCEYGPAEGAKVVTAGAAELFGTETGFTK
ncbi:MAG: membrane fusion protein MtrC, partial [Planctomycetota bacterium]